MEGEEPTPASGVGLQPAVTRPFDRRDLTRAREIILAWGWNATAYQILNPGFQRWFWEGGEGVVGYVPAAGFRVVAGSPVCPPQELARVVADFEEEARAEGERVVYFGAEERLAAVLAARGPFDRLLLGAQPFWRPASWPLLLASKATLRAQLARARNKGVEARRWAAAEAAGHPELQRCLREWLATRGLPPLHFLVEPETLERLEDRRIFVAERRGRVVGFLVASPIPLRHGWLIEQIIRGAGARNGTSELLLDAALRALEEDGAAYVTLGLAPLSRRSGIVQARQRPWISWTLTGLRTLGRRFYDFEGLDAFKAKFLPEGWEPVWAITSERRVGWGMLWAIAGAFSGGSPLHLVARGTVRLVRRALAPRLTPRARARGTPS